MTYSPDHFFKFIRPGFKFKLSIPKSFLWKLDGWRCKKATLRRGRHIWVVHIGDGGVFSDGWRKFVVENGVQEFDFIVFKHQGNMVFDFFVFDQSTCEREYPNLLDDLTESDSLYTHKRSKILNKRKRADYASQSNDELRVDNDRCFVTIMTPERIRAARLNVPMKFARSNGLTTNGIHTQVVLMDEAKRTWPAKVLHIKRTNQIWLTGWRKLIIKKDLKVGDTCMFKLVKNGEVPVFKFYRKKHTKNHIQGKKETCNSTIKKTTSSSLGNHPYFNLTMKPSYRVSGLYLPVEFSKSNDLKVGEMILRDGEGRSWKIQVKKKRGKKYLYFSHHFRAFWDANGLKVGDDYKFVLLEKKKAKPPIMIVSYLGMKPNNNHMQVKKETSSTIHTSTRYFISTMKPYSFKWSCLRLPVEFSRSNDLRMGEMILRDDKDISWKVQLNKIGKNRFCLGRGFRDFRVANGLTKGDAYKFELVKNEKDKPLIVNFSLNVDSAPSEREDHLYYLVKVKSYNMYLPIKFVRTNGLHNKKEMILENNDERSWTMDIKHRETGRNYCYISRAWKEFCAANGFKKGYLIKLELVSNGEIPVVKFYR